MLKMIFKNKKNIILIHFRVKNTLKKKPQPHSQTRLYI